MLQPMAMLSTMIENFLYFLSILPTSVLILRNISSSRPLYLPSWAILSTPREKQDPRGFARKVVAKFLHDLDFYLPNSNLERRKVLSESLCTDFAFYKNRPTWFNTICIQSSAMAEASSLDHHCLLSECWQNHQLAYPHHPPEVQLQIARFTW